MPTVHPLKARAAKRTLRSRFLPRRCGPPRGRFRGRCDGIAEQAGFTPREREVFVLVARGKTNAAVAEELVVSENTVKFHIKSIYQKLGIHSKAEVAALVEDGGK
ncbi:MAG: response regulator transcription factor [Slackia sp.]